MLSQSKSTQKQPSCKKGMVHAKKKENSMKKVVKSKVAAQDTSAVSGQRIKLINFILESQKNHLVVQPKLLEVAVMVG